MAAGEATSGGGDGGFVVTVQPLAKPSERLEIAATPTMEVSALRAEVARLLEVEASAVKLVHEGEEMKDGQTLGWYRVTAEEFVRAVVVAGRLAEGAAAFPGEPEMAGSGSEEPTSDLVLEAEIPRAVVVTGIPKHAPPETEKALVKALGVYGGIERVILQTDPADDAKQHAILIFAREGGAAGALAHNDREILGGTVAVFLASALAHSGEGEGKAAAAPSLAERREAGVSAVAGLLASGYVAGSTGVAWVSRLDATRQVQAFIAVGAATAFAAARDFDEKHRVSATIAETSRALDKKYSIRATATAAAATAAASAASIDEKYRVSERTADAARRASVAAEAARKRAMEDERVRRGVGLVGSWLSSAASAVQSTVASTIDRTRLEIARREAEDKARAEGKTDAEVRAAGEAAFAAAEAKLKQEQEAEQEARRAAAAGAPATDSDNSAGKPAVEAPE